MTNAPPSAAAGDLPGALQDLPLLLPAGQSQLAATLVQGRLTAYGTDQARFNRHRHPAGIATLGHDEFSPATALDHWGAQSVDTPAPPLLQDGRPQSATKGSLGSNGRSDAP
jgi:hypothetical protein